jgi:hypothetical protein
MVLHCVHRRIRTNVDEPLRIGRRTVFAIACRELVSIDGDARVMRSGCHRRLQQRATRERRAASACLPFTTDRYEEITMTTVMVFHEVDDVDHWLRSTKREEFFGPLGMTARTFVDPDQTNRVGLIVTVPDLDTLRTSLASPAAADAMKFDGVRPETMVMLVES